MINLEQLIDWAKKEREKMAFSALEKIVNPMYIKDMPKVMEPVTAYSYIITGAELLLAQKGAGVKYNKALFKPPFRLGKKQKRAVLDADGKLLSLMPFGDEIQAQLYVDYLNN